MEEKKLSFFKKIKISILDFDGYQNLAAEKISRTVGYIILLMLIFSLIVAGTYVIKFYQTIGQIRNYISNEVSEITYENYELNIIPNNGEEISRITVNDTVPVKIIINTQTSDETKIQETLEEIRSEDNGILILKDRIIIKNEFSTNLMEYSYKSISEQYNINKIDKNELISLLSGSQINTLYLMFFGIVTIYMLVIYLSTMLVDVLLLTILTYIVTRIAGLRLKYSAIYNIATYSLTLPILLNIIYFVVNAFTGFTIEYFQIMYTAIASIYIITSILMIKSDVIKKQLELNRIIEEQERVKQELKRQEEERKEKEELKRREKEREKKEKEKQKKEEKEDGKIGKEPEGDNA